MNKENLSTKNIKDFTPEDTIYMRIKVEGFKDRHVFLCQFEAYSKSRVVGKVLWTDTNLSLYQHRIDGGWRVQVSLENCALYGVSGEGRKWGHYHWFNSLGYALDPMEEYKVDDSGDIHITKHPSYGVIRASKGSRSIGAALFGTSIKHQHTIIIEIKTAECDRDLNRDWVHGREQIVELEMSQSQFAEFITSMNVGEGVPCTLRYVNGERKPETPYVSKVELFEREFENKMHNIGVDMEKIVRDAIEILKNKTSINKGDRNLILGQINSLLQNVKENIPFVAGQFTEQMDATIKEAKAEIESFFDSKIRSAGLEALKGEFNAPQISDGKKEDDESRS